MRRVLHLVPLVLGCGGASSPPSDAHGYPMRFDDAEGFAKRFDDPSRDVWQKPDEVVSVLALRPDSIVADFQDERGVPQYAGPFWIYDENAGLNEGVSTPG